MCTRGNRRGVGRAERRAAQRAAAAHVGACGWDGIAQRGTGWGCRAADAEVTDRPDYGASTDAGGLFV